MRSKIRVLGMRRTQHQSSVHGLCKRQLNNRGLGRWEDVAQAKRIHDVIHVCHVSLAAEGRLHLVIGACPQGPEPIVPSAVVLPGLMISPAFSLCSTATAATLALFSWL